MRLSKTKDHAFGRTKPSLQFLHVWQLGVKTDLLLFHAIESRLPDPSVTIMTRSRFVFNDGPFRQQGRLPTARRAHDHRTARPANHRCQWLDVICFIPRGKLNRQINTHTHLFCMDFLFQSLTARDIALVCNFLQFVYQPTDERVLPRDDHWPPDRKAKGLVQRRSCFVWRLGLSKT